MKVIHYRYKYRKNWNCSRVCETLSTGTIDKDTTNKIYWNLKNRNLTFEQVRKCFELLK